MERSEGRGAGYCAHAPPTGDAGGRAKASRSGGRGKLQCLDHPMPELSALLAPAPGAGGQ